MQGPFHPDAEHDLGYQLPLGPLAIYQLGIADANAYAKAQHGKIFSELPADQQEELLMQFESGKATFSQVPSKVFFSFLLQNTREGFFSDPIHGGNYQMVGWKLIGFPGARADFMQLPQHLLTTVTQLRIAAENKDTPRKRQAANDTTSITDVGHVQM